MWQLLDQGLHLVTRLDGSAYVSDIVRLPICRPGIELFVAIATNPMKVGAMLDCLSPDSYAVDLHVAWLPRGILVECWASGELDHRNLLLCGAYLR